MKVFLVVVFLLSISRVSPAQFIGGSSLLGPHIGVSNVARATVLGVKFEEGITDAGPGVIGISGKIDYYSSNAGSLGNQTYLLGVLSANYHIRIDDGSFDPFLGFGIGYLSETNKFPDASGITFYNTDGSGFKFIFSFGARYFLSPNFALRLEFGTSLVYAVGGFDFGF
ncbi:MAG: outer membrane beta-barrel protein [Candidatus Kapaibacterium sp.]